MNSAGISASSSHGGFGLSVAAAGYWIAHFLAWGKTR
jgi:hypothetical protein